MSIHRILLSFTVSAAALLSAQVGATVLAEDNFNYGLGLLNGSNGGSGWAGGWTAANVASIVDPAIDISGNRALALNGNNDNAAWRSLATAYSGSEVFIAMNMQVASGSFTSNDFAALWFDSVATGDHTVRPALGIKADINGTNDIFARTTGVAGSFAADSNVLASQSFLVIGRLSKSASSTYNHIDLWFNPDLGDLASPDASFNGNSGLTQLSMLGLRTANLDTGDVVLVDNLRLTTTWAEAMPVPEPTPLALASLGLFSLLAFRRLGKR